MMERCDGGHYMYLPSWRVVYTSRTMTIAVWGVGEGGEGGNHVSFSLFSSFSSLLSSLAIAPSPDIFTREYNK